MVCTKAVLKKKKNMDQFSFCELFYFLDINSLSIRFYWKNYELNRSTFISFDSLYELKTEYVSVWIEIWKMYQYLMKSSMPSTQELAKWKQIQ